MLSPASRALATIKAGKRCKAHGVLMLAAVARMKTRRLWHAVAPGQDGGMVVVVVMVMMDDAGTGTGRSCDTTHLDPGLFFHVAGVVLGLAAAVDGLPLAGRGAVVDSARRGSLPVLHLDEGGRTRQRGRRGGNRHQKRRSDDDGDTEGGRRKRSRN